MCGNTELKVQQWQCPPEHLRFNCHAESEGEEDVQEHDGHDADGEPDHEVLVALYLVCEGGVAALEVEARL